MVATKIKARGHDLLAALRLAAAVRARGGIPYEERPDPRHYAGPSIFKPTPGPQQLALDSEADEVYYGGGAGGGKALSLDTRIPTPDGWTTMGAISVGDRVFDERGSVCTVVAATEVMYGHRVYAVRFDDGTEILADADHQWVTRTYTERRAEGRRTDEARALRRATRPSRATGRRSEVFSTTLAERNTARIYERLAPPNGVVRTTDEIRATLRARGGTHANHAVEVASPLDLPKADLPIPPYTLGAWLGDGTTTSGSMTCDDPEILDAIRADGYVVTKRAARYAYGILGLQAQLRRVGLLGEKHIPTCYLRASYGQRLSVLQGIVDTDGHVTVRGSVEIQLANERLLRDVWRLVMTLGIRATVTEGRATLDGRDCGPTWRIKFTTGLPVARLARKADHLASPSRRTRGLRYVVAVEPVPSVPVRCIQVDSPSHLYLASEALVPTHNSYLLLGYGLTEARFGIIFRRQYKQLLGPEGLIETSKAMVGTPQAFNNSTLIWKLGERQLEFGACDHEDDKYKFQGRAHDFKGFDEIAQFTESQYLYLCGWARTTLVGQRVRIIGCGNPPQNAQGEWVIQRWAPWLDEEHKNPAKPGELRWFVRTRQNAEIEVDGPGTVEIDGELLTPRSRTFIPARVQDNPFLMATDYLSRLQQLPEPLRSQLIYGDHAIGLADDAWQLIPSAWVRAAQARWTPTRPAGPCDQIGADIAMGGPDKTVIVKRHKTWFSQPEEHPGSTVADPKTSADYIERAMLGGGTVEVDTDGLGTHVYGILNGRPKIADRVHAYRGSSPTKARDRSGVMRFVNVRAAAWWALRDALDPTNGDAIALPPIRELRVDLCSAHYEMQSNGVKIEDKDDIKERLGRSPDLGDTYVMANWSGGALLAGLLGATRDSGQRPQDRPTMPDPLLRDREVNPATLDTVKDWPRAATGEADDLYEGAVKTPFGTKI